MAEDSTQIEKETKVTVPAGQEPDSPEISIESRVCGPAAYVSVMLEKYCSGQVVETDGGRVTAQTRPYDYHAAGFFNQATAGAIDLQPVVQTIAERLDPNRPGSPFVSPLVDTDLPDDAPEVSATALNELADGFADGLARELGKLSIRVSSAADADANTRDLAFLVERDGKALIDVNTQDIESLSLSDLTDAFQGNGLEGGPPEMSAELSPRPVHNAGDGAEQIRENLDRPTAFRARFEAMSSGEAGEQANDTNNVNALVNGGFLIISVLQANLATALQANFGFNLANNNGNSGTP